MYRKDVWFISSTSKISHSSTTAQMSEAQDNLNYESVLKHSKRSEPTLQWHKVNISHIKTENWGTARRHQTKARSPSHIKPPGFLCRTGLSVASSVPTGPEQLQILRCGPLCL